MNYLACFTAYTACPVGLFTCKNERHCVPMSAKCNNITDCGDESDESDELCGKYLISFYFDYLYIDIV